MFLTTSFFKVPSRTSLRTAKPGSTATPTPALAASFLACRLLIVTPRVTLAVPFNFVAEELGFSAVGSYLEVIPDYQVSVFAVNRSWAERNRRQLVQFKRGMVRAMRWFFENRESAVDFVAKELKLKPEYARRGYDFYKDRGLWDANTNINIPGMKTTIAIYNETNPPKPATVPEKYIDQSFLNEALKGLGSR
jgi:ABC-type nitrate/sulfonate/bicarbonate transport system substrate-binding protein